MSNVVINQADKQSTELQFGEERWKLAVEGARDGIWDWNVQSDEVFYSARWKEILGYRDDEIASSRVEWEGRLHPDDVISTLATVDLHLRGQSPFYQAEYRLRCKDGSWKWVRARGAVVSRTPDGKPLRFVGAQADITEQKIAAQGREEAERQYREIFENALEGIYRISDGKILAANLALARMLGYASREELSESVSGEIQQIWLDQQERIKFLHLLDKYGAVRGFECRLKRKEGMPIWVSMSARIARGPDGENLWHEGFVEDISARKQNEEDLREIERRLRTAYQFSRQIIESACEGVAVCGRDMRYLVWNKFMEELSGVPAEQVLGRHPAEVFPFLEEVGVIEKLERILAGKKVETTEFPFSTPLGAGWTSHVSGPLLNESGEIMGIISTVRDISARKLAEQKLLDSENRFRLLFESAPVPLWQADFSGVRLCLDELAKSGVGDLRQYLLSHPHDLAACLNRATMLDFNRDALKLAEARDKADLLENWRSMLTSESLPVLCQGLLALYAGKPLARHEIPLRTLQGKPLVGDMETTPAPGCDQSWSTVLFSLVDITARKQAEATLRKSEEKFAALFRSSPAGIALAELETGRVIDVNEAGERVTGYRRDELIGRTYAEQGFWIDPRDRARLVELVRQEGRAENLEFSFRRKDGEIRDAVISAQPIDIDGKACMVTNTLDVTARNRAEDALRSSREVFSNVFRSSPTAMSLQDLENDNRFVDVNAAFERVTGYTRREVLGKTPGEVGLPVDAAAREEVAKRVQTQGRVAHVLHRFARKNGEIGTGLLSLETILIDDRRHAVVSVLDITERDRAEAALRVSQQRLSTIFHASPVAMLVSELETGRIDEVNDTLLQMIDASSAEQVVGRTSVEIGLIDAEVRAGMLQTVRAHGRIDGFLTTVQRLNGAKFFAELSVSSFEQGGMRYLLTSLVDVTERVRTQEREKELQAQLAQAQKMESIGRLAGGVAHDFNNLLTVINGYSKLLLGPMAKDNPTRGDLEEIVKAGERAAALTQQLLAFSRKQILQPQTLNVNHVLANMQSLVRRLVGEDIAVGLALNAENPMVHADRHQLEQVIMNLTVNARDAMPNGGRLLLETSVVEHDEVYAAAHSGAQAGRYAMFAVTDTGIGMDAATQRQIFEPFFTTKGAGKGTGLGLAMVQGIVSQSGGHIYVYSELDHGTTFKIYLPLLDHATPAVEKPPARVSLVGTETILVTEDQDDVRNFTALALRNCGYRVIQASGPAQALEVCEQHHEPIHLVLTDVVMPGASGRELVAQLTQKRRGIRVLYMSGYTDDVIVQHGILEENVRFLQKPFSAEDLARKVREVLD